MLPSQTKIAAIPRRYYGLSLSSRLDGLGGEVSYSPVMDEGAITSYMHFSPSLVTDPEKSQCRVHSASGEAPVAVCTQPFSDVLAYPISVVVEPSAPGLCTVNNMGIAGAGHVSRDQARPFRFLDLTWLPFSFYRGQAYRLLP